MPLPIPDETSLSLVYRISELLSKHMNRIITDDELNELHNWAYANAFNQELFEELSNGEAVMEAITYMMTIDKEHAYRAVLKRLVVML